eukprot:4045484-Ditylum_brightwellii.AAC.1
MDKRKIKAIRPISKEDKEDKGKAKMSVVILPNSSRSPPQTVLLHLACSQAAQEWGPLFHYPPQATEVPASYVALGTSPTYTPDHQYPRPLVPARLCKAYPWPPNHSPPE